MKIITIIALGIFVMALTGCELLGIGQIGNFDSERHSEAAQVTEQQNQRPDYGEYPAPEELIGGAMVAYQQGGDKAPPANVNKECVFDQDCSPSGSDKATCSGRYTSNRYRCDLRTNECIPRKGAPAESFDCRTEFGPNYVCSNGMCVRI